jgi:hypothetical protein
VHESSLCWNVRQHWLVVHYWHFGTDSTCEDGTGRLSQNISKRVKVKVKAAFRGVFGTETCTAYCTLTPRNFLPSPLEALCISQTHSALC